MADTIIEDNLRPIRSDTAILLFSRSAAEESVAKPLSNNHANRAIAAHLIRHAYRIAKRSGLPVFLISERQQQGYSFGERFANAFEQLFARGYERVISIGNDCLALKSQDLSEASRRLDANALVLGPAADGGAYLVAMHRETYDRLPFEQIPWQTPRVFGALTEYAKHDFCCLEVKSDVDSPADLRQMLRGDSVPIILKIWLLIYLNQFFSIDFRLPNLRLVPVFTDYQALRGPPC